MYIRYSPFIIRIAGRNTRLVRAWKSLNGVISELRYLKRGSIRFIYFSNLIVYGIIIKKGPNGEPLSDQWESILMPFCMGKYAFKMVRNADGWTSIYTYPQDTLCLRYQYVKKCPRCIVL